MMILFQTYVLLSVCIALWFVGRGVNRLDPKAAQAGWVFRLTILPGAILWWPYLLHRLAVSR